MDDDDDLMCCVLCKQKFTESKDPRSLDCDHSFCFSCLQQEYQGCEETIVCLECKEESPIPSGGLAAIVCSKFLIRDMRKRNANRDAATNKTQGEYQRLLEEMKNHGVVILAPGTALKDYRYEKSGATLYALFYRKKGNVAEFKHAADLFCKLATLFKLHELKANAAMKSDTMIGCVAIDMDKCLTQSNDEINAKENDIALWEINAFRKIYFEHIESLEKVKNLGFMRYNNSKISSRYLENTPPDRAQISMCCPAQGCCDAETKWDWHCAGCLTQLYYDFDNDQIFCGCGSWDITDRFTSYEVRCGNASHAMNTVSHSQLRDTLQQLQKVKEINILVLGETGVGKSTWINAIANYVTSSTPEEAKSEDKFQCLIDSVFDKHTTPKTSNQENDSVANKTLARRADWDADTKLPSSYLIPTYKQNVRIIDTPGVGNPSGKERDKGHCEDILYFLANSQFKELHGICILMKSSETRLTEEYRYCLTQLFKQLHKSAAKNLIFCLTFSRLTQYECQTSNDALGVLVQMLSDIHAENQIDIHIKIGENVFCFDNEVFEYLCKVRNSVEYKASAVADYKRSWNHSKAECERLFKYAESLNPYNTRNSSSIYEARHLISKIIEPTLSLQQMLGRNTKRMETAAKDCEMKTAIGVGSLQESHFKKEKKKLKKLSSTCKQCKQCLETKAIYTDIDQDKQEIHTSEKICEENVNWFFYILGFSWISSRTCPSCPCSLKHHKCSAYSQITVHCDATVENIKVLKDEIDENKQNLAKIATIVAKFSFFLQKNALATSSDIVEDELKLEKKRIKARTVTDTYTKEDQDRDLETLRIIRQNHTEEKKKCENLAILQIEEISKLCQELYAIHEIGAELKRLVDIDEEAKSKEMTKTETILKKFGRFCSKLRQVNIMSVVSYMTPRLLHRHISSGLTVGLEAEYSERFF